MKNFLFAFVIAGGHCLVAAPAPQLNLTVTKYPLTQTIKETESQYTRLFLKMIENWPKQKIPLAGPNGRTLHVKVFETPENSDYIGIEQGMMVSAPLTDVSAVLDDVGNYVKLFPGFEDIHVESHDANKFDVYWENIIPVFFISNIKFWTTYIVDKSNPNRHVYRAQLREKKGLNASDTLIVLETEGTSTKYSEYDFFDADYGILKTLAPKRIWKESVEAIIISDLAIKLKAEKPQMSYEDIQTEAKKQTGTYPLDELIDSKKPYSGS